LRENRLKAAVERGDVVCGAGLTIMAPALVELVGLAGFDFVVLDEQHGWMNPETTVGMVRAAETVGLTPMVRVPEIDPPLVGKFLDMGVQAVAFPGVGSAQDARKAVASVRYEPHGTRGSCPTVRAAGYSVSGWTEHYRRSNRDIFTMLLIETREGFDNLDEIVAVEGIDALLLGPFDLSSSLGVPGQVDHPEVVRRVQEGRRIALDRGVVLCGFGLEFDSILHMAREGTRMFWISGTIVLARALNDSVAAVREAARQSTGD
jgi:4-hydroxy-2-oxoheptanedioate aldolase